MENKDKSVRVINTATGAVGLVPRTFLNHPVFGKNYVEVRDGVKPYARETHRPMTPEEFRIEKPFKTAEETPEDEDETEEV